MAVDFAKLMAIFREAVEEHSPEHWDMFLKEAVGDDVELCHQVRQVLQAHASGNSLFDRPAMQEPTVDTAFQSPIGSEIGPYRLREQIGEGGMGVVYVAEQTEPVKRKVALKIIKPGMATKDVVARFEAERQALAMMDHPHIAQVHDAGATESGLPYFVMELVRGVPITEFCDERQLTTRHRLQLFIDVCQAIQHAHQKGVIHRDIKPSNVLVTLHDDRPVVKVIDFGVAKAINQELAQQTLYTQFAQMIGTPLYMSPEQAEMNALDVDTRSDVYSLGVVLYELMTGATPFDRETVDRVGFDEMRRMIREVDPPRPSQRVTTLDAAARSTVSVRRSVDVRQLRRILRGELDWIVMKALEKDRTRRYESPGALAVDLQRHLRDDPVEACPPSHRYQLRKMILRHKSFFAATAAVLVALTLGVIATSWQTVVAMREKERAEAAEAQAVANQQQAVTAEERSTRHLQGALDAVDQMLSRVGDTKLKNVPLMEDVRYELLEDAVRLYDRFLQDAPDDLRLKTEMAITERRKARVLLELGRNDEARKPIERSIRLLREQLKAAPNSERLQIELARSQALAAAILDRLQPLKEAVALLVRLDSNDTPHRDAVLELAFALSVVGVDSENLGEDQNAEQAFAEAEGLFHRLLSRDDNDQELRRRYIKHLANYSNFLKHRGNYQAVAQKLNEAVTIGQSLIADQRSADNIFVLATALQNRGVTSYARAIAPTLNEPDSERRPIFHAEADRDLQTSIDLFQELVRQHPAIPMYRERLAGSLLNRGINDSDPNLAIGLADQALEIMQQLVADYPSTTNYRRTLAAALSNVAVFLLKQGRELERAEQFARKAIRQQEQILESKPEDATALQYMANHYGVLAELLTLQGCDPDNVIDTCSKGLQVAERLRQRYPDNEFVRFVTRRLTEMKREAEIETTQGNAGQRE